MLLQMGTAPAPGAADDALVVGFGIGTSAPISSFSRARFGARARRTTAEAAVIPIKPTASFRLRDTMWVGIVYPNLRLL